MRKEGVVIVLIVLALEIILLVFVSYSQFFASHSQFNSGISYPSPYVVKYTDLKNRVVWEVDIEDETDVEEKREELIQFIWSGKGFPTRMPDEVERDIKDDLCFDMSYIEELGLTHIADIFREEDLCSDLENLERIDRIVVRMEYGMDSIVYLFHPIETNNKLVIYHHGHAADFRIGGRFGGIDTIEFFLDKGYSVMAFNMPLVGMNKDPPPVALPSGEEFIFKDHEMRALESNTFHPVKFFVEPIAVSLNYLDGSYFESVSMIGLSGGGWTTTLYSAIDPRISKSYPVAGSLPLSFVSGRDYEQKIPELYNIANYLELYILGSYGENRKQIQVLNKYDSCCFRGVSYAKKPYEWVVDIVLDNLGKGEFDVFIDDSHDIHKISNIALINIIGNAVKGILEIPKESEISEKTLEIISEDI